MRTLSAVGVAELPASVSVTPPIEWFRVALARIRDLPRTLCFANAAVVLRASYFAHVRVEETELNCWKRRLSRDGFDVVQEAIDANQEWRRDAQTV